MSSDLIAFLAARLDEAAAAAWAVHDVAQCDALLYEEDMQAAAARTPDCDCGHPARMLREVAAGRALLKRYKLAVAASEPVVSFTRGQDDGYRQACEDAIRDLAAVDGNHPDYRPEWKPDKPG